MNLLNGANLRRAIPAAVVAAVLAVSYIVQAPLLASGRDVGYGYRNNCGVKGDGTHDHGKACPNRPFPGHGHGVLRILAGLGTTSGGSSAANATHNDESGPTGGETQSQDNSVQSGKNHGKGHHKGHGRGDLT